MAALQLPVRNGSHGNTCTCEYLSRHGNIWFIHLSFPSRSDDVKARMPRRGRTCSYFTRRTNIESAVSFITRQGATKTVINTVQSRKAEPQTGWWAPSRTPFHLIGHERVKEKKKHFCLLVTSAGKSEIPCYLRRTASWLGHTPRDSVLTAWPNFSN